MQGVKMKRETIIKVLNRYCKGLYAMEQEAITTGESIGIEHYRFDKKAIEEAIEIIGKE